MKKRIICALVIFVIFISCAPTCISANSFPFTDVKKGSWQYEPIKNAYDLGLMNGVSNTRFEPNKKLTRAEAAMILYNLKGRDASYSRYSFKDVKPGAWYADAVEWMYKNGIAYGITKDRFGVNEYITRQDLITFIYRMYEKEWGLNRDNQYIFIRASTITSFKDYDQISAYAFPAMKFCAGICMVHTYNPTRHYNVPQIIKGSNGRIYPKDNCTRAEAAVIIGNVFAIDSHI